MNNDQKEMFRLFKCESVKLAKFFTFKFLLSGLAYKKGIQLKDVNPKELLMGIDVEMEHTDSPYISMKIALDHLAEIPDYYTRLAKMEELALNELGLSSLR